MQLNKARRRARRFPAMRGEHRRFYRARPILAFLIGPDCYRAPDGCVYRRVAAEDSAFDAFKSDAPVGAPEE